MNLSEDHSAIFLEEIISKQVPFCINIQPIIPRFQERGWKSDVNQPQAIQRRTAIKAKLLSVTVAAFGIAAIATPALADF